MIRFLEANGYDVSYISGVDVAPRAARCCGTTSCSSPAATTSTGRPTQRANVEAARDAGVNLAFFSGNEVFWKTRWEPSTDGTDTADRTLVSYKDTHFDRAARTRSTWTGTWRDPRFTTPADSITPENALTGQSFLVNSGTSRIKVPDAYGSCACGATPRPRRSPAGQTLHARRPSTLGYEWDVDADNGFRPAGPSGCRRRRSAAVEVFTDYGSTTDAQRHRHAQHDDVPRAERRAGVRRRHRAVGLGPRRRRTRPATPADRNMQQATVNLFADMGAQPATLQSRPRRRPPRRPTRRRRPRRSPRRPRTRHRRHQRHDHRHRDRRRRRRRRRRRGLDRRRRAPGIRATRHDELDLLVDRARRARRRRSRSRATDDSGNIETPGAGVHGQRHLPVLALGHGTSRPRRRPTSGDTQPGRGRRQVQVRRVRRRSPASASTRPPPTPARTSAASGPPTASGSRRPRSAARRPAGWQTVTFATPVAGPAEHDLRRVLLRAATATTRPRRTTSTARPRPGRTAARIARQRRRCTRSRNTGTTANGVYAYGAASTFPTDSFSAEQLLGRRRCSRRRAAPGAGHRRHRRRGRHDLGQRRLDRARRPAAPPTSLQDHAVRRHRRRRRRSVTGTPPATTHDVTGLTTGTTYRFTVRRSTRTATGRRPRSRTP